MHGYNILVLQIAGTHSVLVVNASHMWLQQYNSLLVLNTLLCYVTHINCIDLLDSRAEKIGIDHTQ